LYVEGLHLQKLCVPTVWERLTIDHRAIIVTPWHQAANRIREMSRGDARHGSCGQGVGEARWDDIRFPEQTITAGNLHTPGTLTRQLRQLRDRKWEELQELVDGLEPTERLSREVETFTDDGLIEQAVEFYRYFAWLVHITGDSYLQDHISLHDKVIMEGAQGVLLDEKFGFHPYTTWTNTTLDNALSLLADSRFDGDVLRLGLIRGYGSRHGAGPFVTEDEDLTKRLPESHNGNNEWQQSFRLGYLDMVALNYALEVVGGVDSLAVTSLDRMAGFSGWQLGTAYDMDGRVVNKLTVVRDKHNRQHMIALTEALFKAQPIYQEVKTPSGNGVLAGKADFAAYLEAVSQGLSCPIRYVSFGPTAADKQDLAA
jgi:adenylosuccinate synthase